DSRARRNNTSASTRNSTSAASWTTPYVGTPSTLNNMTASRPGPPSRGRRPEADVPQPDRAVPVPPGQHPARRQGHGEGRAVLAPDGGPVLARGHVHHPHRPLPQRLVVGRHGERLAVRRQPERAHFLEPFADGDFLPPRHVPELHHAALRGR